MMADSESPIPISGIKESGLNNSSDSAPAESKRSKVLKFWNSARQRLHIARHNEEKNKIPPKTKTNQSAKVAAAFATALTAAVAQQGPDVAELAQRFTDSNPQQALDEPPKKTSQGKLVDNRLTSAGAEPPENSTINSASSDKSLKT